MDAQTVTLLLQRVSKGDREALDGLIPLVYGHLRSIAANCFRGPAMAQTLQPTALVHEAFMRLLGDRGLEWRDRAHFLALSAKAMRQILADHARARRADKRGGARKRVALDAAAVPTPCAEIDLMQLNDALEELAELDARHAQMVEMRFFSGMTTEEVAEVLGVSRTTVNNDWRLIKAWLRARLEGTAAP